MTLYDVHLQDVIKEFAAPNQGQRGTHMVRAVDGVNLEIERGEFFALLGPSGCGKTTTLRMIAGFEHPSSGKILIRGREMQDVPAFHRPVNTVFQDYALFPHLTVLQNVLFGLRMEGVPKAEARQRAQEALALVRLPNVGDRKPTQLSGGQQQRVALARALVKRPAVLLLDEPLGALDLKLRKEMQYELKSMQQQVGITFIFVTHDQEEAMTMANRIAVMDQGKVLQIGSPKEIYEQPTNRFVADFIGETNFITGDLLEKAGRVGKVRLRNNMVIDAQLPEDSADISGEVTIPIRPERIGIVPVDQVGTLSTLPTRLTVLDATLLHSDYIGTDTRYTVRLSDGENVVVRVQNVDYQESYHFENEQTVKIFWPLESTYILHKY